MSNQQWKAKWKRDDIAFHQSEINPLLPQFWPTLGLTVGDTVLVPLCGKSLDMDWLLAAGYKVFGIELSNIAIQAFFATILILFFVEFLPKTIFKNNPNLYLKFFSIPLLLVYIVLFPVSKIVTMLSFAILSVAGIKQLKGSQAHSF